MNKQIIECVPNISEGRDLEKIHTIANIVKTVQEKQQTEPLLLL